MTTQGRALYDKGWRQGCLISIPANHAALTGDSGELELFAAPENMTLVLATQDCDLVKATEGLPLLEAIGCVEDPEFAMTIRRNNARYFVLDHDRGFVADRAVVALVSRDALEALPDPPEPCGGDARHARRFALWLGARYDRVPLPDLAVEHLQRPLTKAVAKLCSVGKPYADLNGILSEVRAIGDLDTDPPFEVSLIFILTEGALIDFAELAIAEVLAEAGFLVLDVASEDELDASTVHLKRWVAVPPSRVTLAPYLESTLIPLSGESYRGEETIGAEPLDAGAEQ